MNKKYDQHKKRLRTQKHHRIQELIAQQQYDWELQARPNQRLPRGDWLTWLILAGRGFGKTRTGAEAIRYWALHGNRRRIAIIGETEKETRQVMVEGPSGILAVHPPDEAPLYEPSKFQLTWPNGAMAVCYSGDRPDQLRGPQFDAAWVDELAKFKDPQRTWEQLMFCLRLGSHPQAIVTTTPRPDPFLKALLEDKHTRATRGSTFDNESNLSPNFLQVIRKQYGGTRLGRQELMAEILDDDHRALWSADLIKYAHQSPGRPEFRRLVIAIDPAVSHHPGSDETGIIVVGSITGKEAIVLEDLSLRGAPIKWARVAVEAYHRLDADRIVAEINMGGDLVEQMLRSVDMNVSYRGVRATRGKLTRAEPIAALYEQGRIRHAKPFPQLERQMLTYHPGAPGGSPDRLDALVWALSDLMLKKGVNGVSNVDTLH